MHEYTYSPNTPYAWVSTDAYALEPQHLHPMRGRLVRVIEGNTQGPSETVSTGPFSGITNDLYGTGPMPLQAQFWVRQAHLSPWKPAPGDFIRIKAGARTRTSDNPLTGAGNGNSYRIQHVRTGRDPEYVLAAGSPLAFVYLDQIEPTPESANVTRPDVYTEPVTAPTCTDGVNEEAPAPVSVPAVAVQKDGHLYLIPLELQPLTEFVHAHLAEPNNTALLIDLLTDFLHNELEFVVHEENVTSLTVIGGVPTVPSPTSP